MIVQTKLLSEIFDENQISEIDKIIKDIKQAKDDYKTIELWEFDKSLGGVGAYCQGCDPAQSNPFQGTEFRNIYRCLQYVRSDIDILNINDTSRYIIENCGHYLEEAIKLFIKKINIIFWITIKNKPLGQLTKIISGKKILKEETIEKLKMFINLYNISKHEILSNETLDRTFHADDAIIYYYASRIIGKEILLIIDKERTNAKYQIEWNKYGREINRF